MIKRIAQGSVLFLSFFMGSMLIPSSALAQGMQGMSCDQCIQQCQERERVQGENLSAPPVRPASLSSVVHRGTRQTGIASSIMTSVEKGSCEQRCSRLSVSLCLRSCQRGGKVLAKVCNKQCEGTIGHDHDFCMETCSSSQSESGCTQDCEQARCF